MRFLSAPASLIFLDCPAQDGDIIKVLEPFQDDGWVVGELKGRRGLAPCPYLESVFNAPDSVRQTNGADKNYLTARAADEAAQAKAAAEGMICAMKCCEVGTNA